MCSISNRLCGWQKHECVADFGCHGIPQPRHDHGILFILDFESSISFLQLSVYSGIRLKNAESLLPHAIGLLEPRELKRLFLTSLNLFGCGITRKREGELDAVAVVHSYEDKMPAGSHKTRLTALNVPPIGLFYPMLLVPDVYPPPPRSWFHDYEDMLEDTWQMDFPRRTEMPDGLFPNSFNVGFPMWDNYPVFAAKPKKEEKVGLAEAITSSILSTGRIELQRKLFCSIQLIGGVALTAGFVPAVEERVLHAIPSNEAIDTVEVLQSRTNPTFVSWKGGAILGILDFGRDAWIHREDWIRNGIHIGSGRKYKDSYFLQAQAMCYINS
ncbi:hypothetical protein L484_008137 [Morus notabilis]|uniref:Actin-related protein 9 n=1 Tax=Morus notabilis TaxID=981085 RepID=W9RMF0_9ROSA|nr:hypothetical protein L484_008137 [Morus notabilis]